MKLTEAQVMELAKARLELRMVRNRIRLDRLSGKNVYTAEQKRADQIRVRGYFDACARKALVEMRTMRVRLAENDVAGARENREAMVWATEQASMTAKVIASEDVDWIAEVAMWLEECFG